MISVSAIHAAVNYMAQRARYRRPGWNLTARAVSRLMDNDSIDVIVTSTRQGNHGAFGAMRNEEVKLDLGELTSVSMRGDDQLIGLLQREFDRLFVKLFPPPLPAFRIGLRSPKRLQMRKPAA